MIKETDKRNQNEAFFVFSKWINTYCKLFLDIQRNGMTIQLHNVHEKHVFKNYDLIYFILKLMF